MAFLDKNRLQSKMPVFSYLRLDLSDPGTVILFIFQSFDDNPDFAALLTYVEPLREMSLIRLLKQVWP